jgi:hypothetical protein
MRKKWKAGADNDRMERRQAGNGAVERVRDNVRNTARDSRNSETFCKDSTDVLALVTRMRDMTDFAVAASTASFGLLEDATMLRPATPNSKNARRMVSAPAMLETK